MTGEAQTWLEGDFHINRDYTYYYADGESFPPPPEWKLNEGQAGAYRTLADETAYLYSLRLYGARFTYIPGDARDGVEDRFSMELLGRIPDGDPRLTVTDLWFEGRELFIHTRYALEESQAARLRALESTVYPVGGGWGEASVLEEEGRLMAVEAAVRQSIRHYWQPREHNRPREITGQVFLRDFPRFGIKQGNHHASVMVRFRFDDPIAYPD